MAYSSTFAVADTSDLDRPILCPLDGTTATEVQELGSVVETKDGRRYVHVYFDSTGNDVKLAGHVVVWADSTAQYIVEGDISNNGATLATGVGRGVAGIMCAANADNNHQYMWIQTDGFCPGVRVGTGVAANEPLVASSTEFLEQLSDIGSNISGADSVICGFALGAATDAASGQSVADVMLHCRGA